MSITYNSEKSVPTLNAYLYTQAQSYINGPFCIATNANYSDEVIKYIYIGT